MLDVDVADRCRRPSRTWPRRTLCRLDSGALADAGPQAITWDIVGRSAGRLELEAVAPSTLVLAEAGRTADARAGPRRHRARQLHSPAALSLALDEQLRIDPVDGVTPLDVQQIERPG